MINILNENGMLKWYYYNNVIQSSFYRLQIHQQKQTYTHTHRSNLPPTMAF